MKKSKLSMFSLICGITATTFGVLLLPLSLAAAKNSTAAIAFGGFVITVAIFAGIAGTITAAVKRLSTEKTDENKADLAVANKGFWFSVVPTAFWLLMVFVGFIAK